MPIQNYNNDDDDDVDDDNGNECNGWIMNEWKNEWINEWMHKIISQNNAII